MKKLVILLSTIALTMLFASPSFSQIFLDGDGADWDAVPAAVADWVNGEEGLYPEEVGAIVTDNVDIKTVKAKIVGNVLFWYIQMHGGPAWPNNAKKKEVGGVPIERSRGYYHVLIDLDNDVETGWKSDWYETHYTTVGYLASQGVAGANPIGAELLLGWGAKYYYPVPHSDSGGIKNSGVQSLGFETVDVSEYDGVSDNELMYGIGDYGVSNPDSAKGMKWQGNLKIEGSNDDALNSDSLRSFFHGHAWGFDFIEAGYEITPNLEYFAAKGKSYFNEGDVLGICGFSETPADDWGVDITTRGEFVCPKVPVRPFSMTFDGEAADWADVPYAVQDWVNGEEGLYPEEVGAIVTDNVDIKDVKAIANLEEDVVYWQLVFHGGPAWPNNARKKEVGGVPIERTRGYYHTLLDLDNNVETGWKSDWYETHYTTVGYLASQGVEGANPLGAELLLGWGGKYYYPAPHSDSGGIKNSGVQSLGFETVDVSEYDGVSDNELMYGIAEYGITDPDSSKGMRQSGLLVMEGSNDETLITGCPEFHAHAWGYDFVELGYSLKSIKQYFVNKSSVDYLKAGDVIGICGFSETPADDWGVDITTRGEFTVTQVSASVDRRTYAANGFALEKNYPNPFNPSTQINYKIPMTAEVTLTIYNSLGQAVRTLVDGVVSSGKHQVTWDGRNNAGHLISSGLYYYTLKSESFTKTMKMMLIK